MNPVDNPAPPVVATPPPLPDPAPAAPARRFPGLRLDDLVATGQARVPWLWHGYLAPGNVTLLTSQWKAGKTTLMSILLSRLREGGTLAGQAVRPGRAAVVSEESPALWHLRSLTVPFGDHVTWFCRPFEGKPRPEEWLALLDELVQLQAESGLDLLVIDTLASVLRHENDAGSVMETLLPLQRLTRRGTAVLALHHPTKGHVLAGQAARGSGVLSGHVDIALEMRWHAHPDDGDRRRRLQAYSRYDDTPRHLVIELTADGTDYVSRGDFYEDEFTRNWMLLQALLADAPRKLTRKDIQGDWASESKPPDEVTLWRWLERARAEGRVAREGKGRKNDPYRYWLPGQEEQWRRQELVLPPLPDLPPLDDWLPGWARKKPPKGQDGRG
jgi:AAA domain